ncbi:hypothetical protein HDU92_007339 [Lobulomyces angularis]|nr:hypothetical protein HDU92_007339 [Lobulomyces angularis]
MIKNQTKRFKKSIFILKLTGFVYCFLLPLIISFLIAFLNSDDKVNYSPFDINQGIYVYGPTDLWCWIGQNNKLMRLSLYGPVWVTFFFNILLFFYLVNFFFKEQKDLKIIKKELKSLQDTELNLKKSDNLKKLTYIKNLTIYMSNLYLSFLIVWIPCTILRIWDGVTVVKPPEMLLTLVVVFTPLGGFFLSMIYFYPQLFIRKQKSIEQETETERCNVSDAVGVIGDTFLKRNNNSNIKKYTDQSYVNNNLEMFDFNPSSNFDSKSVSDNSLYSFESGPSYTLS